VWDAYLEGNLPGIRRYCETDVLNTYLVYLRFELLRGRLARERYAEELERVKVALRAGTEPHFAEFLRAWEGGA
jgi:predicted PolB exonuclease-like 3'-5' exonuclease